MMIGQSFSPIQQQGADAQRPGTDLAPQQAIQILRLRLPQFFGAGAPAPAPLLTSPGAPAGFDLPMMQRMIQTLMGGGLGQGNMGGGFGLPPNMPSAPSGGPGGPGKYVPHPTYQPPSGTTGIPLPEGPSGPANTGTSAPTYTGGGGGGRPRMWGV